jgi:MoaA/NifB/PqqE/SkfB family radical SAM enzyme
MLHNQFAGERGTSSSEIDFLWVELTNQCNLRCVHCYAESDPTTGHVDQLNAAHYEAVMLDAYDLGCRRVQFIGGEPTLNPALPDLIRYAASLGYTFIEVFTNLTRLNDVLVELFVAHDVHVATSVYASDAVTHDRITLSDGSFQRTVGNLRRLVHAGVPVRAGVIEMQENEGRREQTFAFLRSIGVDNVGSDTLREFGRACGDEHPALTHLCGGCADKTVCVGSDGKVSPCIMSKFWSVGSILDEPFTALARSPRLSEVRQEIYDAVVEPRQREATPGMEAICTPKTCIPYGSCSPNLGPGPCAPTGCSPCYPKG